MDIYIILFLKKSVAFNIAIFKSKNLLAYISKTF